MKSALQAFRFAFRAATLRSFDPSNVRFGLPLLFAVIACMAGLSILSDWLASGQDGSFQIYGVNAVLALTAASVAVMAAFSSRSERLEEMVVLGSLFVISQFVVIAVTFGWPIVGPAVKSTLSAMGLATDWGETIAYLLLLAWLACGARQVFRGWEGPDARRGTLRGIGLVASSLAIAYLLPLWPTFEGAGFDRRTANGWELLDAYRQAKAQASADREPRIDRWASIELAQPALLERKLAALTPPDPRRPNLYVVAVGGWSSQDVFLREASSSADVLSTRFGTGSRTLLLINSDQTMGSEPTASLTNLATALQAIGRRIDRERDAVMLVLTSHGSRDGFALSYGSMIQRMLSPADLNAALDAAGIRNRIVVVSACYSGAFVPVLANDDTAVFTASSADTSSFGCSNEREWTYFGDAFFNQALREPMSLTAAFGRARDLIQTWEARDGLTPSHPQSSVGAGISARFPELLGGPRTRCLGGTRRGRLRPLSTAG